MEEEAGRPGEDANAVGAELVAGEIHVQLLPTHEALGMSQGDGHAHEAAQPELIAHEHLARATNRTTAMTHAELGRDDQDVARLFGDNLRHGLGGPGGHAQMGRVDLALAVVVERARGRELVQQELDRTAVLLARVGDLGKVLHRQRVHGRDGEPALGTVGLGGQVVGQLHGLRRIQA